MSSLPGATSRAPRWRVCSYLVFVVLTVAVPATAVDQYRAFWADAFHTGYMSASQVDTMVSQAVQGRYNVIIMEVLAYQDDTGSNSHGAFWKSSILPWAPAVTGSFDPLAYVVQRAHANGIEVDAWLIPYRVSSSWPPSGNSAIPSSGQWLMVPYANRGTVAKFDGTNYWLDPGSPDVQNYLAGIVTELVTNYEIDGIHWDYEIGSGGKNNWYYADASYDYSGCARFKRIYGYASDPLTTDANWADFRRREVSELHARTKAEMDSIAGNPRQPLRHTSCVMAYDPVPACTTAGYSASAAYIYFGDYANWLQKGYIDAAIPMVYKCGSTNSFEDWVDYFASCYASYPRPIYIGQGNYINLMADSLNQMQAVYAGGLMGVSNYSYWSTVGNGSCATAGNDPTWWSYIATNLYTSTATIPDMPWRNPATATEGTLWGQVTNGGVPVDDATVQVGALPAVKTDGAGYYVATLIPATTGSYTVYDVTTTKGTDTATHANVAVFAGDIRRQDVALDVVAPTITEQPSPQDICPGTIATFTAGATGEGTLTYQWLKDSVNLSDGSHYSGVTTATLTVSNADAADVADYHCVVTNAGGSTSSDTASLTLKEITVITQHPAAQNVCPGTTAHFMAAATGEGTINYRWQKNGSDLADEGHYSGTATATLTVSDADSGVEGDYRCVVTAECGSVTSDAAALTLKVIVAADLDTDCDVDLADYELLELCASGPGIAYEGGCSVTDFDLDGDVDQTDFSVFERCVSGENAPPAPNCAL